MNQHNPLVMRARDALRDRLPSGWTLDLVNGSDAGREGEFRIVAPDARTALVPFETHIRLEPRFVSSSGTGAAPRLLVASYLSPRTRDRLRSLGRSYLDLTGNARITMSDPGLYIETQGSDKDPTPRVRPVRTLKGSRISRVVRLLVDLERPPGVREIATRTGLDAGYVSRIVAFFEAEGLVERGTRGQVVAVDWEWLLRRWAEDAPVVTRGIVTAASELNSFEMLMFRLSSLDVQYAVSGPHAASQYATLNPQGTVLIYARDVPRTLTQIGLVPSSEGRSVTLIEPADGVVFAASRSVGGISYVAPSQAAADLLGSEGHGTADAETLIAWMRSHVTAWRA